MAYKRAWLVQQSVSHKLIFIEYNQMTTYAKTNLWLIPHDQLKPAMTQRKNLPNRVLIVEDSKTFATMLQTSVEQEYGFDVDVANTLGEAREKVKACAKLYFMAIVDLHLPDAPHGEAAFFVVDAGIPTLVFTGSDEMPTERLWKMGIADYVHKNTPNSLPYVLWAVGRFKANFSIGVLVVDDMHTVRNHVQRTLKVQNFTVYTAADTFEARQQLEAHPEIQIVVVDHYMEGCDGITFTSDLKAQYGVDSLEIIGMSDDGLSTPFLKAGAIDFLHKPFSNEELLCRINHSADRLDTYRHLKSLNAIKNRFLGMAAHDLRNPIGAIQTTAKMLSKPDLNEARRLKIAHMIDTNCSDILSLLESLLDITAIESGKLTLDLAICNINELIQRRIDILQLYANTKQITITTEFDDALEHSLDAIKFAQVVDNLLSNAIKFSPANSVVTIKASQTPQLLRIEVIDAGLGLTTEDQANLFQPFCTLSTQSTQGEKQTGLGLSIAKNIVEAHAGELFFKPTLKGHSRFIVTLKASAKTTAPATVNGSVLNAHVKQV